MKKKLKEKADQEVKQAVRKPVAPFDNDNGSKPMTAAERRNSRGMGPNSMRLEIDMEEGSPTYGQFVEYEDWDEVPPDEDVPVAINSLESRIGYTSLLRQMQQAYVRQVAFYRSRAGGSLSVDEARAKAFHVCTDPTEAVEELSTLKRVSLESLNFVDLLKLHTRAPRVAERFWEQIKKEGRKEFESGHLAANISFPVGYMKQVWNIARFQGLRESFIADWQPKGGIEISLIDMLAQSYFQWQYWLEQTVKRSETKEREMHPQYAEWMQEREEMYRNDGWTDGYWFRPFVSEQQALEHAMQMVDRWNRMYMRTLRQLRDLRRYSPVTINNPNQVNIASDGGKQVNVGS